MNVPAPSLSPVRMQFKLAATSLCGQTKSVKQEPKNFKSYAQVETLVRPQVVSPKSGGLKPERKRPYRLMARFTEAEKEVVLGKASAARLSMNEYIRSSVLGAGYVSTVDPTKRQHLIDLHHELKKQGNNLNQIAKHLNAGILNPLRGEDVLSVLARSLVDTHMSVRLALSEGQTKE